MVDTTVLVTSSTVTPSEALKMLRSVAWKAAAADAAAVAFGMAIVAATTTEPAVAERATALLLTWK